MLRRCQRRRGTGRPPPLLHFTSLSLSLIHDRGSLTVSRFFTIKKILQSKCSCPFKNLVDDRIDSDNNSSEIFQTNDGDFPPLCLRSPMWSSDPLIVLFVSCCFRRPTTFC